MPKRLFTVIIRSKCFQRNAFMKYGVQRKMILRFLLNLVVFRFLVIRILMLPKGVFILMLCEASSAAKIKLLPLADAQKAVDCLVSVLKNEIILGFIIGHSSYPKQPHNMRDTTA